MEGKQTDVEWTEGTLYGDTVGLKMEATLGPEHLQGGPPKNGVQNNIMSLIPTQTNLSNGLKYIRGHLLNDNVGGPGEAYNLFPITGKANKEHEMNIEHVVKEWVNVRKQWVKYTVEVQDRERPYGNDDFIADEEDQLANIINCTLHCSVNVIGSSKSKIVDIDSTYEGQSDAKSPNIIEDRDGAFGDISNEVNEYEPYWSTSKNIVTHLNTDAIETLAFLFDNYPVETRKYLLRLNGIGRETVSSLESIFEEDIIDVNRFTPKQIRAERKISSNNDFDLLEYLAHLYLMILDTNPSEKSTRVPFKKDVKMKTLDGMDLSKIDYEKMRKRKMISLRQSL